MYQISLSQTKGLATSVLAGQYPDCVHEAGNVAKHRQHYVQPEMHPETNFEEYSEGRDENGEDDAQNI